MSSSSHEGKTIVEIFDDLDYEEDKHYSWADFVIWNSSGQVFGQANENLQFMQSVEPCEEAARVAAEAQKQWVKSPLLTRTNTLYKIVEELQNALKEFPKLKKKLSVFIDYFDFYSDLLLQIEEYKTWRPCGVVCIILSNWESLFAAAATIPAALASGCSVIVSTAETVLVKFLLLLEEIFLKAGLAANLFSVVTAFEETNESVLKEISKVFYFGSYLSAQKFYAGASVKSFNFFCPNNTATFILESADLNAAVNSIISETWGKSSSFAISDVIVQESVFEEFIDKLKYRIHQFMIENKHSLKFKDETIAKKIREVTAKALKAGATVEETESCGKWSPTILIKYQSQEIDEDAPILKILVCKTAKDGVALLNNCRYTLGTSIWSEISSQALEISSELFTPNVWVNCHGVIDVSAPFQLLGYSGNFILGGTDGILEFLSPEMNDSNIKLEINNSPLDEIDVTPDVSKERNRSSLSYNAIKAWRHCNRRKYLQQISNSLAGFSVLRDIFNFYAHSGSVFTFSEKNSEEEFFTVKRKIPVGVILLFITTEIEKNEIVSLILPAITFGNAVIVVLKRKNPTIEQILQQFVISLPVPLLTVYVGLKFGIYFASDPKVQTIWWYTDATESSEFIKILKSRSKKYLRKIWIVPKQVPLSHALFQNKCLHNKVVWLPKIDYFP